MSDGRERRRNLRVAFKTSVCIKPLLQNFETIFSEHTRDVSLRGLYCYADHILPMGTPCEVELRLSGASSDLKLYMQADVVRTDENGMAFKFNEMDLDSMLHLKNLLYYNSGDPDRIDSELHADQNTM